jgi:hypothetical protein
MGEHYLLMDMYCDGSSYRLYREKPGIYEALERWERHDIAYTKGLIPEEDYIPFTEFMNGRGFPALDFNIVSVHP